VAESNSYVVITILILPGVSFSGVLSGTESGVDLIGIIDKAGGKEDRVVKEGLL
jgi:hypothetical protein